MERIKDWSWSASRIKTLNTCKRQFYHTYITESIRDEEDGPFAILGTAIHTALEAYRLNPKMPKQSKKGPSIIGEFDKAFTLGRKHFLYMEGIKILQQLDYSKVIVGELIGVEEKFDTEIFGYRVRGMIDKIERVDDTIVVTDYKTNKSIEPETYITQLAIYDEIIKQRYPNLQRKHELFYVRHNRVLPFQFKEENDALRQILETSANIVESCGDDESKWPQLKKKAPLCNYCPLKDTCWT